MGKCTNCKTRDIAKYGTRFCSQSCSVTYSNKRRSGIDYTKTKKAMCAECRDKIVVNARSSLSNVFCKKCFRDRKYLRSRGKPRRRLCTCCGKLRTKFHKGDFCRKCYKSLKSLNGKFETCRPEWKKSYVRAGYKMTYCPGHPRDSGSSYVHTHVLKAERKVGHFLESSLHVHHVDHDKLNNHKSNLVVLTPEEHLAIHVRERKAKRGKR